MPFYNQNSGGRGRQNYGHPAQRPFNQPNGYSNNNQNRPQKKHSGCKTGFAHGDAARPYVRGWKYDRTHGLRAFIASPNKKTKCVKSKSGREWENWTVKATTPFGVSLHNCLYDPQSKKVWINDLGLMMNASAPNGGYVGPFYYRKNK